jgi:hypothetical protein
VRTKQVTGGVVPESRSRKKADYTPPSPASQKIARMRARRWVAPVMVACWLVGLAWIVVFYIAPHAAFFDSLGNWNLLIGMVFIAAGFVLSTKWE